jgi:hypothetical protein
VEKVAYIIQHVLKCRNFPRCLNIFSDFIGAFFLRAVAFRSTGCSNVLNTYKHLYRNRRPKILQYLFLVFKLEAKCEKTRNPKF